MTPMDSFLASYQKQAADGLFIYPYTNPIGHCALGLAGEAGEVCDLIKKSQYDPAKEYSDEAMMFELGDVLWYTTNLANQHGLSLKQIIIANVHKLTLRHSAKKIYSVEALLA